MRNAGRTRITVAGLGLLAAAVALPVTLRQASVAAAVPAVSVPGQIGMGAEYRPVPYAVTTDADGDDLYVSLSSSSAGTVWVDYLERDRAVPDGARLRWEGTLTVYTAGLPHWDGFSLRVEANDFDGSASTSSAATTIRAGTRTGIAATRSGGSIVVQGAAVAYHSVADRFVPWGGARMSVEVGPLGQPYRTVATRTADAHGRISVTVPAPERSWVRVVTADTPTLWGAASIGVLR
jgi:hypothetical protein